MKIIRVGVDKCSCTCQGNSLKKEGKRQGKRQGKTEFEIEYRIIQNGIHGQGD